MDGVAGWFAARGEIPLVPPPGLREYGPLSDDPDRADDGAVEDAIRGVAFGLEYCDLRGWASTRTVRCLGVDWRAPVCLKAFCAMRGGSRSFRIDRIISITDLRSGRILEADAQVSLLASYLNNQDPDAIAMRTLKAAVRHGVYALLQIGMVDGRLDDRAREIVLAYINAEAGAVNCPLPASDAVELWIDNLSPPIEAVVSAVDQLLAEQAKFGRLLPWLLKLVRTRDDFAVQEQSLRELISEVRLHYRRKLLDRPSVARG